MELVPKGNRLIVKRQEPETESKGGIVLPEKAQTKTYFGEVLSTDSDVAEVGDLVVFDRFAGTEVELDEVFVVLPEKEVLAVLEVDGSNGSNPS